MAFNAPAESGTPPPSHFIRNRIEEDQRSGALENGIKTRFPPEPNGYLHIGHAKSVFLNFGLPCQYGGVCHLRFDDTNPEKENIEYVQSIFEVLNWLGVSWSKDGVDHLYYASDYYETLYRLAERLIEQGKAYVDSESADEIRLHRGTAIEPGVPSRYRDRTVEENLDLFHRMRAGEFKEGQHVLRAKIDLASPNFNLRDPVIYRIRYAHHYRTGDAWCVYPLYDYAHCISDALENITHSLCTLEFEDHRPLYDWILNTLADADELKRPLPQQIEFARLNVTYTITSKRKLLQLVTQEHVDGWDDPRMPTLAGLRRRGFTPSSLQLFCERIGISKADSWIDMGVLEQALRDDLDPRAHRLIAVLDPIKLIIDNYPAGETTQCYAPHHPHQPITDNSTARLLPFSKELWIEREDFSENPAKGFFRLFIGNRVRLRYGFVIECTGVDKDAEGNITAVHANYFPDSQSGTPGANTYKVKGNIHWLSIAHAQPAPVRLYDRLFNIPRPDATEHPFTENLNPTSKRTIQAWVEPGAQALPPETHVQFERHGYFVTDRFDSAIGKPVFNRITSLKDSWGAAK